MTELAKDAVWGHNLYGQCQDRLGNLIPVILVHQKHHGHGACLQWSDALQASLLEPASGSVLYETTPSENVRGASLQ